MVACNKKNTVTIVCIFLSFASIYGSENARQILDDAMRLQKNRTFSATLHDIDLDVKIIQRLNPDGTVFFKKETTPLKSKGTRIGIDVTNGQGRFQISPLASQQAVKFNYHEVDVWDWYYIYDRFADYSIKTVDYEDIPCYLIQKQIQFKDNYYSLYLDFAKKNFVILPAWVNQTTFRNGFPALMQFYIGKQNKFIYETQVFNPLGKLLGEKKYSMVTLDPKIKDSSFALPEKITIIPIYSREEKLDALKQQAVEAGRNFQRSHNQPAVKNNFFPKMTQAVTNAFWSHVSAVSYIFAGMAMVMLIIVAILKKKK